LHLYFSFKGRAFVLRVSTKSGGVLADLYKLFLKSFDLYDEFLVDSWYLIVIISNLISGLFEAIVLELKILDKSFQFIELLIFGLNYFDVIVSVILKLFFIAGYFFLDGL
jgi:hypothetical protein